MAWSSSLVRVRGIPVTVHLTFVLLVLRVALGSGEGSWTRALVGVAALGLLFTGVALDELGHALAAGRLGVPVWDITLLPIRGVARMEVPDRPGHELRIALAGPLVNAALAGLAAAPLLASGQPVGLDPIGLRVPLGEATAAGLASYLVRANLALGLFNLLPAFPMDGGRVLRAMLALRGDHLRATTIAVTVGQVVAGENWVLVLIAAFVWLAARAKGELARTRAALRRIPVRAAMPPRPAVVFDDEPLARALALASDTFPSDFPVRDRRSGRLIGLLGREDLRRGRRARRARTGASGDAPGRPAGRARDAAVRSAAASRGGSEPAARRRGRRGPGRGHALGRRPGGSRLPPPVGGSGETEEGVAARAGQESSRSTPPSRPRDGNQRE
jgi:Zn-dependent protease